MQGTNSRWLSPGEMLPCQFSSLAQRKIRRRKVRDLFMEHFKFLRDQHDAKTQTSNPATLTWLFASLTRFKSLGNSSPTVETRNHHTMVRESTLRLGCMMHIVLYSYPMAASAQALPRLAPPGLASRKARRR
jgi:hypothetical protein